jgi:hypothetical protein
MAAVTEQWRDAWVHALDELELTLEATERLLNGDFDAAVPMWTPPVLDGPLPAELAGRAQALQARQNLLINETVVAVAGTRQKLELLDKLNGLAGARYAQRPVYLDLAI